MIGRTNTGGGGGDGSFNFRIIGGTSAPSNPRENDIWVNTNTKVTEWAFAKNNPFAFSYNLNIYANHIQNTDFTLVRVQDVDNNYATLGDKTVYGATSTGEFTEQTVEFTMPTGQKGKVVCSVDPTAYPCFTGTVYIEGNEIGSVSFGNNGNVYSGDWGGDGAISGEWVDPTITNGAVWISAGASSPVEFNALTKNNITVYPISAKQYVNGAWVDKTAKSYQSGAWVEWWDGTLYDAGNEYEFVTGGWKGGNVATSSTNTASIVKNTDSITIKNATSASNGAITVNAIDLTNYSTLNVEYSGSNCGLRVSPSFPTSSPTANINGNSVSSRTVLTLDISALEGSYQCALSARSASSVTMYKMWLE